MSKNFSIKSPTPERQPELTDTYFKKTRAIINNAGDVEVTYAVFMRRPVTYAGGLAVRWLKEMANHRKVPVDVKENHPEGAWIGAGEPICFITGLFSALVDLETIFLQKLGSACVAAYNAYSMCIELPKVSFLAMDARHCAGSEMAEIMAYGASIGSEKAKKKVGAVGFVGSSTDATSHFFGKEKGMGTMPHSLIGYAGSTIKAAKLFNNTLPHEPMTVLVDYFGKEITDSLEVAKSFPDLIKSGSLSLRIDTHGGRFIEGLDTQKSYAVLERNVPSAVRGYRTESDLKALIGTGVSAASIWYLRETLDNNGFEKVKITASSGFDPDKCRVFALANAPVDTIGTGSYLPKIWSETYATADVISYNGEKRVKVGREFLLKKSQ